MSKLLTADDILNTTDIVTEKVECPEWGGYVYVRALTARERDTYEASLVKQTKRNKATVDKSNIRAKLCIKACVKSETDHTPLFTQAHLEQLALKSSKPIDRIFSAAARLSGISDVEDEEEIKND